MVGEAAGIGILLFDVTACFVHQQPVEDVGCLAHGGRDVLGREGAELI